MRTRTPLLALAATCAVAMLAPAANAAVPFTVGTGHGPDIAVGTDGSAHVAWLTDEAGGDKVGYCRVPPGGTACDTTSTLSFAGDTDASTASDVAQIFAPAANKVVIFGSCSFCDAGDTTWRFISASSNGTTWATPVPVGSLGLGGTAAFVNTGDVGLGVSGGIFQGLDDTGTATTLSHGGGFDPSVAVAPSLTKAVWAANNLTSATYRVFTDPTSPPSITRTDLNTAANWSGPTSLPAPEPDIEETVLASGPVNGIHLTYKASVPGDTRIGLRKFNATTNVFSAPTYVEGSDPIENVGITDSNHTQDPGGRIHVVWRALYSTNRLRYVESDTGGGNFTAPLNLASGEDFEDIRIAADSAGNGFAVWRDSGQIRVVAIDPQPEPAPPGGGGPGGGGPGGGGPGGGTGPDTTRPTAGGFSAGDTTLTPGQGTSFTFTSSEAGMATLTVQKRVPGLKVRRRGRTRCVPATRGRLRALRRQAGSRAAFRRLLRRRRCNAYKRIGRIQQAVTPGRNTIVFSGRIAGRRLRPGRYRATLVITDSAGNVSRVETVRFRVLRRRR